MASILLVSELLEKSDGLTEDERKEIGAMISKSVREQMSLFRRVPEILRSDEVNSLQLTLESITVRELIETAIKDLKPLAAQKEIGIHILCDEDYIVKVDVKLMSQVIRNLLSNGIKFSHKNSAIHIYVQQETEKIQISLADNGLGFNPEDSAKLFNRFTVKGKLGTENEMSTGMGLYLSRKIITAHHCNITASSKGVNKSAVFAIELLK